jgi:exosortase/archaeosortase family protein
MKRKLKKNSINDIPSRIMNKIEEENKAIKSNEKKQFIYFILGFLLSYLALTFIVSLFPQEFFKQLIGSTVEYSLNLFGNNTITQGFVPCNEYSWFYEGISGSCYSFLVGSKTIHIAWLCTGLLEIIILISAMLASFGIKNEAKIIGVIIAVIVGVLFNLLRIVMTINIALTQNTQIIEFAHDILFKIVLFIYITVFYVIWFYWASKSK